MNKHTSSLSAANSAVARIVEIAADVANLAVQETLAREMSPVQVLCPPEAAGGDGAALCALGDRGRGGCVGGDGEAG